MSVISPIFFSLFLKILLRYQMQSPFMVLCRSTPTHIIGVALLTFVVIFTYSGIYYLPSAPVQSPIKTCVYNVTPVLRPKCAANERTVCGNLNEVTTFLPCFPSTLLDSRIACHDSYSCQKQPKKADSKRAADVSRRAFFSALYTDNDFLEGALVLGYTLKKYHPNHPMYMMHFHNQLSNRTLCSLRQAGWIPRGVDNITPPLQGVASQFIHQFTKLSLWNMTEFDSIIYLDADNLVLGDISHLNELVADPSRTGFEFAAVADNWNGKFAYHFNAGVIVLHPSADVFNELMRTMSLPGNYDPIMAEQAFLNAFFQLRYLQLPVIYNVNLAMYSAYPDLWNILQSDFKVVHFTVFKPFLKQSNTAYEVPVKLYTTISDEYMKSAVADQIKQTCV